MGITPNRALMRAYIKSYELEARMQQQELQAVAVVGETGSSTPGVCSSPVEQAELAVANQPAPSSRSRLEPILREQGALVKPPGRRKPGRPRIIASWFPAVAASMADGTSLRTALAVNGLHLSASEMRALYRNRTFREVYQEARRRYFIENYGRKPTLRALVGRYV